MFEFSWIQSFFPKSNDRDIIYQALTMNLGLLPSKILFTYFVFYVSIPRALKKDLNNTINLVITLVFLFVCILFRQFCATFLLLNNPEFYKNVNVSYTPIFNLAHFFVGLLDLGFISGIAIALKLFRMQLINLKTEKNLFRAKLENELQFLKNQLNPHFLFNTLNNIYALARKKSNLAPELIMKLSKFMRFMLYESQKNKIPIAYEIKMLEDYVDIEKVRFSKELNITFNQRIDNYNQLITPLVLLPFIENAFKHGPGEMDSEAFVNIDIILQDGWLTFVVINSKDKDDAEKVYEKIGMGNVRRQLELLYNEFKLEPENSKNIFKINLSINLNKNVSL